MHNVSDLNAQSKFIWMPRLLWWVVSEARGFKRCHWSERGCCSRSCCGERWSNGANGGREGEGCRWRITQCALAAKSNYTVGRIKWVLISRDKDNHGRSIRTAYMGHNISLLITASICNIGRYLTWNGRLFLNRHTHTPIGNICIIYLH